MIFLSICKKSDYVVVSFQSYNWFKSGNLIGQEHVMNFHNLKKLSGLADFHPFCKNLLQQNLSKFFSSLKNNVLRVFQIGNLRTRLFGKFKNWPFRKLYFEIVAQNRPFFWKYNLTATEIFLIKICFVFQYVLLSAMSFEFKFVK